MVIGTTTNNLETITKNVKIRFSYGNVVAATFYFTTIKNLTKLDINWNMIHFPA